MTRTHRLRPIVEALDREMARFHARRGVADADVDADADATALLASWAELVEVFALAPPPELRACPSCGGLGSRAATRCGRCGRALEPPAAAASA